MGLEKGLTIVVVVADDDFFDFAKLAHLAPRSPRRRRQSGFVVDWRSSCSSDRRPGSGRGWVTGWSASMTA